MWIVCLILAWVYVAGVVALVIVMRPYAYDDAPWWSLWPVAALWPVAVAQAGLAWLWRLLCRSIRNPKSEIRNSPTHIPPPEVT